MNINFIIQISSKNKNAHEVKKHKNYITFISESDFHYDNNVLNLNNQTTNNNEIKFIEKIVIQ